jgi:hypothetical protein
MPENESFVFDTNLGVKVRFLPGAHKLGVQVEDQLHVLDGARVVFIRDATGGRTRREWLFLGDRPNGEALEVIAVPGTREHFLVIHAMPMRKKWQPLWNWMQQGGSS